MKKYEAVIGFFYRHTGTEYKTIRFEAENQEEAESEAKLLGNNIAYRCDPYYFFVKSVSEV